MERKTVIFIVIGVLLLLLAAFALDRLVQEERQQTTADGSSVGAPAEDEPSNLIGQEMLIPSKKQKNPG